MNSPPSPAKRALTTTASALLSPAAKKPKKYPSLFYLTAEDEQRDDEADALDMAAMICRVKVRQAENAKQEAADVAAMKDGTLSEAANERLLKKMFPNTVFPSSSMLFTMRSTQIGPSRHHDDNEEERCGQEEDGAPSSPPPSSSPKSNASSSPSAPPAPRKSSSSGGGCGGGGGAGGNSWPCGCGGGGGWCPPAAACSSSSSSFASA